MTFADEIFERKQTAKVAHQTSELEMFAVFNAFELRIMHLEDDLDNAHEDLANEKALSEKLKGKLDVMVELVGELVECLNDEVRKSRYDGNAPSDMTLTVLGKAKESMP